MLMCVVTSAIKINDLWIVLKYFDAAITNVLSQVLDLYLYCNPVMF